MALSEGLEGVIGEIGDCFSQEEDEDKHGGSEEGEGDEGQGNMIDMGKEENKGKVEEKRTRLESVIHKTSVIIDVYSKGKPSPSFSRHSHQPTPTNR